MAETASLPATIRADATGASVLQGAARVAAIPWYLWTSAIGATSAVVGLIWDISWHISIGRDTFWTPAHLAVQLCAVLAAVSCGYLIFSTTFGGDAARRAASVRVLGFRAPLGAFMAAWGGIALLTSAPFDNWWHNAYGLDVEILSPPHVILGTGIVAVEFGGLILILGHMNRAEGALRGRLQALFLYTGGMIVSLMGVFFLDYTDRVLMHSSIFYAVVSLVVPIWLVAFARASRWRWAGTIIAAVYTALWLGMHLILPLFPAEPKLGPVYQKVSHFVPLGFPLLLIVPAFVLDMLWPRIEGWNKWRQAAVAGAAFLATLVATQWPMGNFLMSPAARNWLFHTDMFYFAAPPDDYEVRNLFYPWDKSAWLFWRGMGIALAGAILSTRVGLMRGDWMRRIRR
jgi:hypothetical protein